MKLKSILTATGLTLALAATAQAQTNNANPDNNGHHHCGGNSGQGVGNYCGPTTGGSGGTTGSTGTGSPTSGGSTASSGGSGSTSTSTGGSVASLGAGGTPSTSTSTSTSAAGAKKPQHHEFCHDRRHDEWRREHWRHQEQGSRTTPAPTTTVRAAPTQATNTTIAAAATLPKATGTPSSVPEGQVIGVDVNCPYSSGIASIGYSSAPLACGSTVYSLKPGQALTPSALQCLQSDRGTYNQHVTTACTLQRFYTCPTGEPATACYTVKL